VFVCVISGNREIVGPNHAPAQFDYMDIGDLPYPAVRFCEMTPQWRALREKEAGDWSKMTIEEKKQCKATDYFKCLNSNYNCPLVIY